MPVKMSSAVSFISKALILAGLAAAAYGPGFRSPFHLDDYQSIVGNPYVAVESLSLNSLSRAAFQDFRQNRPLTNLSFALNYYFNRLNTMGYHLVNFSALLLTALGIWLLLRRLLIRLGYDASRAELAAWLTALLWTLHPLNAQAVTYIVQRHSCMAGMFSVWSIYLFHLGMESRRRRAFFAASGFLCLMALLSKESAAAMPAIIFGYKIFFFDGLPRGWLRRNWKWIFGLAVFYLLGLAVLLRPGMWNMAFGFPRMPFNWEQRLLTVPRVLLWYVQLILFPFPQFLTLRHAFSVSESLLEPATTLLSGLAIAALAVLAVLAAKKHRAVSFAIIWYFGQLLIESMPVAIDLVFEHRLYLASLAVITPAVCLPLLKSKRVKAATGLLVLIALFFGFFSRERNLVWASDLQLWKEAVSKNPRLGQAWELYCVALVDSGNCRFGKKVCGGVIRKRQNSPDAQNALGVCYMREGKWNLAKKKFLATARFNKPGASRAYFNIGLVYSQKGDLKNAMRYYSAAIIKDPGYVAAHYNLAQVYRRMGDQEGCISELREVLRLQPELDSVRAMLDRALSDQADCEKYLGLTNPAPLEAPAFSRALYSCLGP